MTDDSRWIEGAISLEQTAPPWLIEVTGQGQLSNEDARFVNPLPRLPLLVPLDKLQINLFDLFCRQRLDSRLARVGLAIRRERIDGQGILQCQLTR